MKIPIYRVLWGMLLLGSAQAELPRYEVINLEQWWATSLPPFPGSIQPIGLTNAGEVLTTQGLRTDQGLRLWKEGAPVTVGYVPVLPGYDTPFSGNFMSHNGVGSGGIKAIDIVKADPSDPSNYLKAEYHVALVDTRNLTIQTVPDLPDGNKDFAFPYQSPNAKYITSTSDDGIRGCRYEVATSQWLEVTTGGRWIIPAAVNDQGAVVGRLAIPGRGYQPFIYSDGAGLVEIKDGTSTILGEAIAINNSGMVTGTASGRAFVFNSNTFQFDYITPAVGLKAVDINEAGAIIGSTHFGGNILGIPTDAAFYWDAENGLSGFEQLIGPAIDNWFITDVSDINDDGWILAKGFNRQDERTYHVLLRTIPEPNTTLLMLAGGLALLRSRRRKRPLQIQPLPLG
jgi:hypothetical protein